MNITCTGSLFIFIDTSSSLSTATTVTVTFLLTAIFLSILTVLLTLLFFYMYIKRTGLRRKEPVKPIEQDMYEEVQSPDVISPVVLTTNPVYGPIRQWIVSTSLCLYT